MEFLDSVASWGKQHVFLYNGPPGDLKEWKASDHVLGLLKQHRLGKLFNARLPPVLPDKLTLSSVTHSDGRMRVMAVQKRAYAERTPEHDEEKETDDGERISLKAYVHHLTLTLAVFEWDLNANVTMLQVTQLRKDGDYEEVAEEFFKLVSPVVVHEMDDDLVWRLVKNLDVIRGKVLRRLEDREPEGGTALPSRRPNLKPHPAIEDFLLSLRRA